jgi:hypothetical protein
LLAIVIAAVPMATVARGLLAAVLGLAGVALPWIVVAFPPWQIVVLTAGALLLVPGLLVRDEYREQMLPRVLVTIGVLAVLAPLLIPDHGEIPLVQFVKALIDAPGKMKLLAIVGAGDDKGSVPGLALIVVVVLSLLAWMPAPATGGAKVFAWLILLWPVLAVLVAIVAFGDIGHIASKSPDKLLMWAPGVTYSVLVGYGLATIFGKQLE